MSEQTIPDEIEEALLKSAWMPSKYKRGVEYVPQGLSRGVEDWVKARGTVRLYDRLYYFSAKGYLCRVNVHSLAGRFVG
jgi:hypothetical protein